MVDERRLWIEGKRMGQKHIRRYDPLKANYEGGHALPTGELMCPMMPNVVPSNAAHLEVPGQPPASRPYLGWDRRKWFCCPESAEIDLGQATGQRLVRTIA